jgi:hypothetical protein
LKHKVFTVYVDLIRNNQNISLLICMWHNGLTAVNGHGIRKQTIRRSGRLWSCALGDWCINPNWARDHDKRADESAYP